MRILALNGSPIKGGNTEAAIRAALEGAGSRGAQIQTVRLYDLQIAPCDACNACQSTGRCIVEDAASPVLDALELADAILFASPVYWFAVSGPMKNLVDRTYSHAQQKSLAGKRFGVILVQHSSGAEDTLGLFRCFADEQKCSMLEPVIINTADKPGVVAGDVALLQRLHALGERRAAL